MIGRSGERGSGISVLAARHDDDDDDDKYVRVFCILCYSLINFSLTSKQTNKKWFPDILHWPKLGIILVCNKQITFLSI